MWWDQTLKDIEGGKVPKEPIGKMLFETIKNTHVSLKVLKRLVDYQMFDIERGDINSIEELEVYAENTRSLTFYLNYHLLGIDNSDAIVAASHVGRCVGICDVIKKTPYYLAKHRNYMPTDILHKVPSPHT